MAPRRIEYGVEHDHFEPWPVETVREIVALYRRAMADGSLAEVRAAHTEFERMHPKLAQLLCNERVNSSPKLAALIDTLVDVRARVQRGEISAAEGDRDVNDSLLQTLS